jgi:hypothetical protein
MDILLTATHVCGGKLDNIYLNGIEESTRFRRED